MPREVCVVLRRVLDVCKEYLEDLNRGYVEEKEKGPVCKKVGGGLT